jgi:hypothetical protein
MRVSLTWNDQAERLMAPEPSGLGLALVYATGRRHVSVYRPTGGQWRLVLMAPLGMPDELLIELARPRLTDEEAAAVECGLGAKHLT